MIDYNSYREAKLKRKIIFGDIQRKNQKYKENCLKNPTKAELIVKNWLEENKIRFFFQKGFIAPFHRIVDFYIPQKTLGTKRGLIIEIDGGYHTKTKEKDFVKDTRWDIERNMDTIRISNEEVYNQTYKSKLLFLTYGLH